MRHYNGSENMFNLSQYIKGIQYILRVLTISDLNYLENIVGESNCNCKEI